MDEESKPTKVLFHREITLHDRETNRGVSDSLLAETLNKAREFQKSKFESVQVSGYILAGQIRAEMRRRQREGEAAWAAGVAARRIDTKVKANPHGSAPGSREDNCWRAGWMAEDHNIKEAAHERVDR